MNSTLLSHWRKAGAFAGRKGENPTTKGIVVINEPHTSIYIGDQFRFSILGDVPLATKVVSVVKDSTLSDMRGEITQISQWNFM